VDSKLATQQVKGKRVWFFCASFFIHASHLTGEFIIVAKFGGHALRHLASRLANVVRQGGRLKTYIVLWTT